MKSFIETKSKKAVSYTHLKELADYLKSLDGETRVVMEHTGRYYEPVARFLHDEGDVYKRQRRDRSGQEGR